MQKGRSEERKLGKSKGARLVSGRSREGSVVGAREERSESGVRRSALGIEVVTALAICR